MAQVPISLMSMDYAYGTRLPGTEYGPGDAARHLMLSAEMVRKYGTILAEWRLDLHEKRGGASYGRAMDQHNNNNNGSGISAYLMLSFRNSGDM